MLLSLLAPRPVLLELGLKDHATDPKGLYLSEVAASPVYELLGGEGVEDVSWPPAQPVLGELGLYVHDGGHELPPDSWPVVPAFLQQHLAADPES